MKENSDKYLKLNVEEIVKIISSEKIEYEEFIEKINKMNLSSEDLGKFKMKVDFAYERMNKPLSISELLINFFIPFGVLYDGVFIIEGFKEFTKFRERGYLKKQRDAGIISLLGSLFYMVIFSIIIM